MAISSISGASALLHNSSIKKKQENTAQDMAVAAAMTIAPPTQASTTQAVAASDATAKTKYTAQDIAQRTAKANDEVMNAFLEIAKKTPTERFRDQILKAKGLTEEDVAAMTPEKREALEKEIADMIKDKIEEGVKKAMLNPERVAHPAANGVQLEEPEFAAPQLIRDRGAGRGPRCGCGELRSQPGYPATPH